MELKVFKQKLEENPPCMLSKYHSIIKAICGDKLPGLSSLAINTSIADTTRRQPEAKLSEPPSQCYVKIITRTFKLSYLLE